MPRTQSSWSMDTPFTDGKIIIGPQDMLLSVAAAADAVLTRNAAGDWSWNQIASKTNIYAGIISSSVLERIGQAGDFQENYGTATPGNAAGVGNAGFTGNQGGPQDFTGRPPVAGATYLNPTLGNIPKGFKLTDVTFVYAGVTVDLVAITCRVDKTVYANLVAPAVTPVLATGVNGLLVANNANPRVIKVATPGAVFNFTDNAEINVELSVQTNAGGTAKIYRMILHGTFNYN
jgi:hypothetical protein